MTPAELAALAEVMRKHRVLRCGDVELHPSAFGELAEPAPLPIPTSDPAKQNEEALLFASSLPMTEDELRGGGPHEPT